MRTPVLAFCLGLLLVGVAQADSLNVRFVGGYECGMTSADHVALDSARNLAFLGTNRSVRVVDVSNPGSPVELSRAWVNDEVQGLSYQNNLLFVADYGAGLRIFSVADPAHPVELGHYTDSVRTIMVAASGGYAYIVDVGGVLRVISITDPAHPVVVGLDSLPSYVSGLGCLVVVGDLAYQTTGRTGLRVISVADPANPVDVGSCDTLGNAGALAVAGGFAYVGDGDSNRLEVISVADSSNPVVVGQCRTRGAPVSVALYGSYACVADSGLTVISVSDPAHPAEDGHCAVSTWRQVAVLDGYAYVPDEGRELYVVSVIDPAHPAVVGLLNTYSSPSGVAAFRGHAYLVGDSFGLSVMSTSTPAYPFEAGKCTMPVWPLGVALCGGGKYAYVADRDSGLRVVSIADSSHPREVASVNTYYANAVALGGDYAYVADDTAGLRIVSVMDPTNPVEVGHWHYSTPGEAYGLAVSGDLAFLASGRGGLRIVSVADPAHPVEVGYDDSMPGKVYGVAVRGDFACVAGDSGLRVISINDPTHPVEVGFSDTLGSATSVAMTRDNAYVVASGNLWVMSIAAPAHPVEAGFYALIGNAWSLSNDVALDGGYVYVVDNRSMRVLRFYGDPAEQLGDLDVDPDSLEVSADTLRLGSSGANRSGALVLVNTTACYNSDPKDGPSLSSVGSLHVTGSLAGPGGTLDSILVPNLPESLYQGQTAVCTLSVHVPSGLQNGDYAGSITITGRDVNNVPVDVTFYALLQVNNPLGPLGDLDVDPDSLGVVHDTMNLHTNPAGPNYSSTIKAEFMLVNTDSAYNPNKSDGPSRSPLREVKVEAKVEARMGTAKKDVIPTGVKRSGGISQKTTADDADSIYVTNLPESLAVGQAVACTLALAIPTSESLSSHSGWVVVSAMDTIGYQVQDSFFLKVTGPEPWKNLDSFRVAPIPFKPHQNPAHDAIHFWGLPAGARVIVYDASGQSVWSATASSDGQLKWDAKVASGIYVYLVVSADGKSSKVGKLSVIR
ncbi:MAG TPA: T9SS type A sorting domain-containing protein [bacterium]|nr:T9SS type A sorting domain-containing protein [bacterium]